MGLVGERADDGIVDRIPESGDKHQGCHGAHTDAKHVGVENHEKVADEHPAEVATHITHAIGEFADEGDLPL